MLRRKYPQEDISVLVRVCELFVDPERERSTKEVADKLNSELLRPGDERYTREQIYPLLREARRRGLLHIAARADERLSRGIEDRYGHGHPAVRVVPVYGHSASGQVALETARSAVAKIKQLGRDNDGKVVHIGLAGGRTMARVAQEMSILLRSETDLPKLALHAVSSGFDVYDPGVAPIAFFGYFADVPAQIEYVGLFVAAEVKAGKPYEIMKRARGVAESFESKDEIQILVTSLATAADEHNPLRVFFGEDAEEMGKLVDREWVGDVAYLPYSSSGPVDLKGIRRAVTLFELDELRDLVRKERVHVILAAGPCPKCHEPREVAVQPLLENPKLKFWSEVIMDLQTAQALVR